MTMGFREFLRQSLNRRQREPSYEKINNDTYPADMVRAALGRVDPSFTHDYRNSRNGSNHKDPPWHPPYEWTTVDFEGGRPIYTLPLPQPKPDSSDENRTE